MILFVYDSSGSIAIDVFIGDMSFVGPRPERQYFIDQINRETDDYRYIYLMRPGLTSYATIHNGYTDSMDKMLRRLELDLEYLDQRSIGLDLQILLSTFAYCVKLFFRVEKKRL